MSYVQNPWDAILRHNCAWNYGRSDNPLELLYLCPRERKIHQILLPSQRKYFVAHSTVYHHLSQQSRCIKAVQSSLRWRYTVEWAIVSESVEFVHIPKQLLSVYHVLSNGPSILIKIKICIYDYFFGVVYNYIFLITCYKSADMWWQEKLEWCDQHQEYSGGQEHCFSVRTTSGMTYLLFLFHNFLYIIFISF